MLKKVLLICFAVAVVSLVGCKKEEEEAQNGLPGLPTEKQVQDVQKEAADTAQEAADSATKQVQEGAAKVEEAVKEAVPQHCGQEMKPSMVDGKMMWKCEKCGATQEMVAK